MTLDEVLATNTNRRMTQIQALKHFRIPWTIVESESYSYAKKAVSSNKRRIVPWKYLHDGIEISILQRSGINWKWLIVNDQHFL